jgi:hypothetical protein
METAKELEQSSAATLRTSFSLESLAGPGVLRGRQLIHKSTKLSYTSERSGIASPAPATESDLIMGDGVIAIGVTVVVSAASSFVARVFINSLRVEAASSTSSKMDICPARSRL